jgi:osomolarity two-component system phosphorelay intermediate protein YPD1
VASTVPQRQSVRTVFVGRAANGRSVHRGEAKLGELSSLGHFLKGSSATLGFTKIKDSCQEIQQYGHKMKLDGTPENDGSVCLAKIAEAIKTAKADMVELEKVMEKFFNGDST